MTEEQLAEAIVELVKAAVAPPVRRIAALEAQVRTLSDQVVELAAALAAREPVR